MEGYCICLLCRKEEENAHEVNTYQARSIFFSTEEAIVVFDSPSQATQCALRLGEVLETGSLLISLHVGECNAEDGKPSPIAVDEARHIARFSSQGRILVTQTLRSI